MSSYKPINDILYEAFLEFVKSGLALLRNLSERGKKITETIEQRPVIENGTYHGYEYELKPDYRRFLLDQRETLREMPEFRQLRGKLVEDENVQRHYRGKIVDSSGRIVENPNIGPFAETEFIISPFIRCISAADSLSFNQDIINEEYRTIENILYHPEMLRTYCYFAPLFNFGCCCDEIDLDDIRIRKITPEILEELWHLEALSPFQLTPLFQIMESRYIMETTCEHLQSEPIDETIPRRKFENLISALRMYKEGDIGFSVMYRRQIASMRLQGASYPGGAKMSFPSQRLYFLDSDEVQEFQGFGKRFTVTLREVPENIRRAIDRFSRACEEGSLEDRLIDFWIAMELLFCKERSERGSVIAVAASMLIGQDNAERKSIREFLEIAYGVRNDVIHKSISINESLRNRKMTIDATAFTREFEAYLRRCNKKLLQ